MFTPQGCPYCQHTDTPIDMTFEIHTSQIGDWWLEVNFTCLHCHRVWRADTKDFTVTDAQSPKETQQ